MNRFPARLTASVAVLSVLLFSFAADAALTVAPITWNVIGLDSNDPATGPTNFPIGTRVCSDVATTNVQATFTWDSANALVDLRAGSLSTITIPSISAGGCQDAYFEVVISPVPAAFDTVRRYHITATDFSGSVPTITPREVYVEHLISQNRNSISDVKFGASVPSLASVPPGGGMNLVVGNTYVVQLIGGTATQGYNQFEAFINFSNTVFQILSVSTTYSANDSPYVTGPFPAASDKLYADACLWDNDPNSPTYRDCVGGDFKSGGTTVITTYTIKVIGGGGTSETLNTLLYDFSGSSFHYNSDYAASARIANVIDPTTSTISKSFSPDPAPLNGVSALTFTLTNPNPGTVTGYNFVDNLPANLVVATPPSATTSGCGAPALTAVAGSSSISFSNGTLAANSTCSVKVNVTPTATGTLNNTTGNLFIDAIDTGDNASASLTVNAAPPPGTGLCNLTLARWNFPTGMSTTAPAATTANVTATAAAGAGIDPVFSSNDNTIAPAGTGSWGSNGSITPGGALTTTNDEYFEFALDTTGYTAVYLTFDALFKTPNGPTGLAVYYGTSNARPESGTSVFDNATAMSTQNVWTSFGAGNSIAFTSGLNPSGTTYFRIYAFNSGNSNPGSDVNIDNVLFTGCAAPLSPTLAKSFAPDPVAVNGVSTLTFTLTNPNSAPLTGAAFTDSLPGGVQVAATPSAATTCGGTWAPAAASTSLTFSGGTIPASGLCTVSVNVTVTTSGPHSNVSGFLSTAESGTTITTVATDTLTAVLPPVIAKQFDLNPILAGAVSTLTFTIANPNQDDALSGVAFSDTLPTSPASMTVAPVPNASTTGCGAPTFSPSAGAGVLTFSGGTIAGGATCIVTVDVTVPEPGTYANTTGTVSHVINSVTVPGNTASANLEALDPTPSISVLKQIGPSASGPWTSFVASNGPVYYRFTVENTGDVPLDPFTITDNQIDVSTCNAQFTSYGVLPVAVAANDNHIVTCVVGPFSWPGPTFTNTANATGEFNATPYGSADSTADFAIPGLTLDKTATETTFTAAGETLQYSYLVTNSGAAPLAEPVTVTDDKTTVTCPAVTTVGDLDAFLDPGESVTCTATYLTTLSDVANGGVTNTATASADGVSSPNDSVLVPLATAADVSIVKTLLTAGPFTVGQSIQYTLDVANAGPATATSVQVTDTPTNLTVTNVSGGGCAALPCTIASLASGGSVTITVTATINAAGAFDNSASANGVEVDPDPTDNTDNTDNGGSTGVSADVSILKTLVTAGPYSHGQSITYTLFVANAGPSTATSIQVTDTPTSLTITNVSGGGCAALPCTIPSLASGADVTITVTATINAAGAFDNSASANGSEPDPNSSNNTDSSGNNGTAAASADVSIVKTLVTAGPYSVGQSITYTLFVANAGPSTATSIQVTDTPTNLTITNVSGGGCAALPCTIPSLASGADATITVTATIDAAGAFDNSASANGAESDPNLANNTDNTGNNGLTGVSADVSVVKTLTTSGPFTVGQSIAYTLFVANAGPSTATNVQVTDTPSNLTITNVSGGGCAALPCTIPSLVSGADATINVTATINAAGAFDNSAAANGSEPDPNPANNTDATGNGGTASAASADLQITKAASPQLVQVGDSLTYTLVLTNNGPSTATNVVVTDPLPSNFALTSATPTQGSCSGTTTVTCNIGTVLNGASVTITLQGTVSGLGSLANTATVSASETDPVPNNNTSTAAPAIGGSIPTVNEYGLLLLAMLMGIAGVFVMRLR